MKTLFTKTISCIALFFAMHTSFAQTFLLQEDFEGAFPPSGWRIFTPSGDYADGWSYGPQSGLLSNVCVPQGSRTMVSQWASFYPNNTWAFTPGYALTAGTEYVFSFKQCVASPSSNKTESLRITVGNQDNPSAQTTIILDLPTLTNTNTLTRVATYTPSASGTYYFAFNCYSAQTQRYLSIDSVSLYTESAPVGFPAPYCATSFSQGVEAITYVRFAEISNTSLASSSVAHEDFTPATATVQTNTIYPLTVKGNTNGNSIAYINAYIDWNQNNSFDDAGETYYVGSIQNSNGDDAISASINITIPSTAVLGNTRMRIVKRRESALITACGNDTTGQAEDYTLNVIGITSIKVTTQNNIPAYITTNGGSLQMVSTILPSNINQDVVWTIINESGHATINSSGLVTADSNGNVWAKATSVVDPTKSDSLLITIINQTATPVRNSILDRSNLVCYPNPAQNTLNIYTTKNHPALTLSLVDLTGKIYQQKIEANRLTQSYSLDLSSLANGIYLLEITGKDVALTRQIIKQ